MKNTFRVVLLAVLAGIALSQIAAHGQSAASQTSQQTTAKPPASKPATPPAAAKSAAQAAPGATNRKPASRAGATSSNAGDAALVAQGKARFQAYGCKDCHGEHGEGTEDGPDLIGTHLNADQIAGVLKKPSSDADVKGMPAIPAASPDLKPLVAYVLSLKGSKAK